MISATQLVGPEDYTDQGAVGRQETALVLRSLGRVYVDLVSDAPGGNAVTWSTALIVMSEEALENTFTADATDLVLHDYTTRTTNMTRMDILQISPVKGYSAAFRFIRTNEGVAGACTDFFAQTNLPGEQWWDWDMNVKRKLKTDQALWLLVTGITLCDNEVNAFVEIDARTLIYDD